jgi:DNA-binding NarL/FixJ family response regulator
LKALIIDDHPMVQDGLELMLRRLDSDIEIIKFRNLSESAAEFHEKIDLILYDAMLPDRTATENFDALRTLHRKNPDTAIIVVTALRDPACASWALEAGARAYILKTFTSGIILGAIRLVLAGGVYVPPELFDANLNDASGLILSDPSSSTEESGPSLTRRQRDVLTLLSQGYSNKKIARELNITEGTIKIHVAAIFKALNVTNRTQAVIAANRLGLSSNERLAAALSF